MSMQLVDLLQDLSPPASIDMPSVAQSRITGLSLDSRNIRPGDLFIALPGCRAGHGLAFAKAALDAGALAVLVDKRGVDPRQARELADDARVIWLDALPADALADLADRFYRQPARGMRLLAVTGTNGKTSVAWLLAQAGLLAGHESGVIGTLGSGAWPRMNPGQHTTPDLINLRATLARLHEQGVHRVCMEVSSHALDQQRVAGLVFDVAMLTNVTRDHLDYHGSMEAYCQAKARLFEPGRCRRGVLPLADALGSDLLATLCDRNINVLSTGIEREADVSAWNLQLSDAGSAFDLRIQGQDHPVRSPLLGRFNVENLLLVAGSLLHEGLSPAAIAPLLGRLEAPPGRMQRVPAEAGQPQVVVDYAHTPDALDQVLATLRPLVAGRLIVLFGCGGQRDQGKRAPMGQVAAKRADHIVLTEDNARGEPVDAICEQIRQGIDAGVSCEVIVRRDAAIASAIATAGARDLVLLAGKGHETRLDRGDEIIDFDDVTHARQALEKRGVA